MPNEIPYAQFRFDGQVMNLTRHQFEQAVRDAKHCRCGTCLCCRALEYQQEAKEAP